ncbi:MAG: C25 family cysteine peptidase [Candidatus Thermoplasmatota archaeon]
MKQAVETWGITYVLLVGSGVKGSEKFPVRNTWVPTQGYEEYFPSDLYYADLYNAALDFSSWDSNGNHRYGEFPYDTNAVDLYPDVYLGRLACHDLAEVKTVVQKIISYSTKNTMTNKIVQMGGDTFPGDAENINEGEYCNERVMEKLPGYTTTQLWGSNGKLTKMNCILAFYQNADFVDFSGHGSYASWATHPPGDDSVWIPQGYRWNGFLFIDATWMYNFYKLPVVVFNACSCSKFSETANCLSWSLVQKKMGGAIATYGASGIGYGSYGSSEDDRLFGWMEVHLFEGLYKDKILGKVWGECITAYTTAFIAGGGQVFDADYKTVEEMTLLGDPSLVIQ